MKLQKVVLMLSLSVCLVGTQVIPTVAQEDANVVEVESEVVDGAVTSAETDAPAAIVETDTEVPAADHTATPTEDTTIDQTEDKQADAVVDDDKQAENPAEEQVNPQGDHQKTDDKATGDAADDTKKAGDQADGQQNSDGQTEGGTVITEPGKDQDKPSENDKPDAGSQTEEGKIAEEEKAQEDAKKAEETAAAEVETQKETSTPSTASKSDSSYYYRSKTITWNKKSNGKSYGTKNKHAAYDPFTDTLDEREKVKFNEELPIEGLPSFITAEMVMGALRCQEETGYPASVTIAQIIQESGYGKYGPGGEDREGLSYLAFQYNNLFGIKGMGPAGTTDMSTGEQAADGTRYTITAGFRVYNTYTECIQDRADLLDRVYKDLTFGATDANTFAMKIAGRWATSLTYGQSLIRVMERYDLYRLDEMSVDEFSDMLGTFVNPCPGTRLTSDFGYRTAPTAGATSYHKGIDLGTGGINLPTYAAAAGTVTFAGEAGGAGNLIIIDHGDGLVTKYMHHDKIYVEEGDEVEKGQQIGLAGTTGISTGIHLHFQVEQDGVAVDPFEYFTIENE